ncbi:DUF5327 family protein [Staphylococcus pseudintermedius]|nr:DUF5327 family protein [Staphylococcus pseudintermedius]
MNKDKLIQLLEHELVQADAATTDAAFEKHIYAIHALTALYTGQETSAPSRSSSTVTPKRQASTQVTDEEIRMIWCISVPNRCQTSHYRRMRDRLFWVS